MIYDEFNVNKSYLIFECLSGKCVEYLCNKLVLESDHSVRSSRNGHITLLCLKYSRKTVGGETL